MSAPGPETGGDGAQGPVRAGTSGPDGVPRPGPRPDPRPDPRHGRDEERHRRGDRAAALALGLFRRHRSGMLLLAVLIGLLSGAGAVLFRAGIDAWGRLMSGSTDYSGVLGPSTGALSFLGRWFVLVAPALSGLVVGPLMWWAGRTTTGHGVAGVMWSSRRSDGAMAPGPASSALVGAALTIGGGGSVGPEGPIAELGASAATVFGRRLGLPRGAVRLLAAAGTAAGIAAAFNAPLAGAFFAMEVVLVDFTIDAVTVVVLASVASTVLAHHLLGTTLSLALPDLELGQDAQLAWVAVLGVSGGVVGVAFSRCRYLLADGADAVFRRIHLPAWARPPVGGLAVGALLLVVPQMYGESSGVMAGALHGDDGVPTLLLVTVAKIVATSLTLAVGLSGGVFAPSLFIGASLGAAFGTVVAPGRPEAAAVFGVLGMGAVFAGSARAPITGVVLIIEMTGQYGLLLPLMLAVVLATFISRFLTRTTIYTEELRRRGVDVDDPLATTVVGRASARTVMTAPPALLTTDMPLRTAAEVMRRARASVLPVISPPGADDAPRTTPDGLPVLGDLVGCVDGVDLASAGTSEPAVRRLADLALRRDRVGAGETATTVLRALLDSHLAALPVVAQDSGRAGGAGGAGGGGDGAGTLLVGWVAQEDMVARLYRHQQRAREAAAARTSLGARVQARARELRAAPTARTGSGGPGAGVLGELGLGEGRLPGVRRRLRPRARRGSAPAAPPRTGSETGSESDRRA